MAEEYLFKGLQGLGQPQQQPETSPEMDQEVQRIYEGLKQTAAQDVKDPIEAQIDEEAWSSDDSLATAQRFFSSAVLGYGDELGIATAAVISGLFIEDTPISQIYKEEKEKYNRKQEEFKKRQGGAAITADILGTISSPLNYVGAPARLASFGL